MIGPFEPEVAAGVTGLAAAYAEGSARPDAVLATYMARIERLNPTIHAFIDLDVEGARDAAKTSAHRWASGMALSPLDGCVVGIKANIAVAGLPWTAGIGAYRDRIADRDAACVARLRAAGAIILGTLNMEEGALGAVTDNPWFGRTQNPWREGYTAGGSSGGSGAAVAAGLCATALGTDTMGSVRIPSAYCGVFGIKPRYGAIWEEGVTPLSPSLDHVGVHARSAEDCAVVLAQIATPDPASPDGPLAVLDVTGRATLTEDVRSAFLALVAQAEAQGLLQGSVPLDIDLGRLRRRGLLISEVEGMAEHAAVLDVRPDGFSETFTAMLRWGTAQPPEKLAEARAEIASAKARIEALIGDRVGLLCPTTGGPAFAFGQPIPADQADITCLANMAGLPAVAFPMGLSAHGMPLSAQIIGRDSAAILELAGRLAITLSLSQRERA
ncbi:amidase [Brevundimonas bacteroides]|uniref:amidase n=1 Tax=Brevundimonas bacteroides TaxID=74311 RepID=UPI00068952C3|nr:amidase [Brevundimonas bacteroides]